MTQSCCMQSGLCGQRRTHNPAFWRPHLLCYFLPQISQMGRVEVCLPHMVLGRELDYGWKYTQMCCHDFCLGLFSFFSKPSLTCSLAFLIHQVPDETSISFVTSSKSSTRCCDTSFNLAVHFSWAGYFHYLIHCMSQEDLVFKSQ